MWRPASAIRVALCVVALGATVDSAWAELVFFKTGRVLSVKSQRIEGESVILVLRRGGEIHCDRSLIERVEPDEVPYPDPEPDKVAAGPPASAPYAELVDTFSARHGVDPRLVHAVIRVESNYEPLARSRQGAMGLMQLMPATARQYSVKNPYDPRANIEAGIRHLKSLLERFEIRLALAAYNAGEAAVRKFRGIPPFPETRAYVRRVLELARGAWH